MYVRGSNAGVEYKRNDQSFYKGTVVQTNDPEMLMRVKVYIPEISNEPLDNWLSNNKQINTKFPGVNNKGDSWSDTKIFHDIKEFLPWAEPCLPLMGESGPGRFFASAECEGKSTISDSNYVLESSRNDTTPISPLTGVSSPNYYSQLASLNQPDANADPTKNSTAISNPHAYDYPPVSYPNTSKGAFSTPNVGAQVWVFHYNGDLNFPVYFGGRFGLGDVAPIMAAKQGDFGDPPISQDYPSSAENDPCAAGGYGGEPYTGPEGPGTVIEDISGKIRDKPISGYLKNFLSQAAAKINVTVVVTSGGQPSSGSQRTGSHRHDHGMAADFMIRDNYSGKFVPITQGNKWSAFAREFRTVANAAGYTTSGGAAHGYMGPDTAHFDIAAGRNPGVQQAVWPKSGRPGWVSILTS